VPYSSRNRPLLYGYKRRQQITVSGEQGMS
jgi:hypothetical protein